MSALVTKIGIQPPAATDAPLILGIGGTLRPTSSSERALAVSLEAVREAGGRTMSIVGRDLSFPPYEPGMEFDENARRFVSALRQCDGLIISGPSYHGGISGLLKNAIDYIEDMAGDERPYLTDRPVGMIVCAAGWQAVGTTLSGLRSIVHALRGWPTPLGAALNVSGGLFDAAGGCSDPAAAAQLRLIAEQVIGFGERNDSNCSGRRSL